MIIEAAAAALLTYGLSVWYFLPKKIIKFIDSRYSSIRFFLSNPKSTLSNTKTISLTINDAPHGQSFSDILDTLRSWNAVATFFVISSYVNESNQQLLIQALHDGHQLANGGHTSRIHSLLSTDELSDEIRQCQNLLNRLYSEAGFRKPLKVYYRPKCGLVSESMLQLQKENNMNIVLGSIYPHDAHISCSLINSKYIAWKAETGDIVTLHDRSWTQSLLQKILPMLLADNFRFVTLSENLEIEIELQLVVAESPTCTLVYNSD